MEEQSNESSSIKTETTELFSQSDEDSDQIEEEVMKNRKTLFGASNSQDTKSLLYSQSIVSNQEDIMLVKSLNSLLKTPLNKQNALKVFTQLDYDAIM